MKHWPRDAIKNYPQITPIPQIQNKKVKNLEKESCFQIVW